MKNIRVREKVWGMSKALDSARRAFCKDANMETNADGSDESVELNIACWGEWGIYERLADAYQGYIFAESMGAA